jgi:formylmethanofuran dehydrogenase subunit D
MNMAETFVLIAGRTSRQGTSLNESKFGKEYLEETHTLWMNSADLAELGLKPGSRVRIRSQWGSAEVIVQVDKRGELPRGVVFIAYGDASSRLMGGDTHGTGMPDSKGIDVTIEPLPAS